VFIQWGKQGSSHAGLMDIYAISLSVGLQYGVPLVELITSGLGLHFDPHGHTDDPEIPRARSVVDYFCRRLAIDWLPVAERAALGVFTISELVERASSEWGDAPEPVLSPVSKQPAASMTLNGDSDRGLLWELATSVVSVR
jgi:ribonucleoside-diphosphate reductase alpha chain